ncbi:MAG: hypothetical protein AAGK32_14170 [Actinomycetota bacterium]
MAPATEKLSEIQDKVIELLTRVQEPVLDGLRTVVDKVEGRVPELAVPEQVPTADELVDNGFGFAKDVLDNQKKFAGQVLKATAPVRDKFRESAAPAAKKASTKKAA